MKGKVIDVDTGKPISNVTVNLLDGKDIKKTNDIGYFEVEYVTGFCEDPEITLSTKGYKPFYLKIKHSNGKTHYITKSETIWVNYDHPFYPDINNKTTVIIGTWIEKWSQDYSTKDTLIIYLMKADIKTEIENIQNEIRNKTVADKPAAWQ